MFLFLPNNDTHLFNPRGWSGWAQMQFSVPSSMQASNKQNNAVAQSLLAWQGFYSLGTTGKLRPTASKTLPKVNQQVSSRVWSWGGLPFGGPILLFWRQEAGMVHRCLWNSSYMPAEKFPSYDLRHSIIMHQRRMDTDMHVGTHAKRFFIDLKELPDVGRLHTCTQFQTYMRSLCK